jgi:hypothetical protein
VGVITYTLVINIFRAFSRAVDFEHELSYVHVNRQRYLAETAIKFGIRALALLLWLLYIQFTIHVLLPYITALAYVGSGILLPLTNFLFLLAAIGLSLIIFHIHILMLRLLLLRPRIIG